VDEVAELPPPVDAADDRVLRDRSSERHFLYREVVVRRDEGQGAAIALVRAEHPGIRAVELH
jgi:hypothetical protein